MHDGQIIILNGAPRSGKSSIAAAIQSGFAGCWMNIGVDHWMAMTPQQFRPGLGLRPGGERPDLEPLVRASYLALYAAIATQSRQGINVVADVGHHDCYSIPLGILPACAALLRDLPAWLVGIHCPLETILERRHTTGYPTGADAASAAAIRRWQTTVHTPGIYDLELDTSVLCPAACATAIQSRIAHGPPPIALALLASYHPPT